MKRNKETKKDLSRRDFIKTAAVGAGATALAGLGAKEAKAISPAQVPQWDYEADVVVVGYGGGGAGAAMEAHDYGAQVLILEKMPKGLEGGNTSVSGGGAVDPYDKVKAIDHIYALCMGDTPNPTTPIDLVASFVSTIDGVHQYIRDLGGEWNPTTFIHDYSHFFNTEPSVAGSGSRHQSGLDRYFYQGGGAELFKLLAGQVEKRGVEVMYGTPAKELIQDPQTREILGVKAVTSAQKTINIKARRGVVMTIGGYENSPELQSSFFNPGVRVYPAGTPGNTGDGILMVQQVGAVLWHMAAVEWSGLGIVIPSKLLTQPVGSDCSVGVSLGTGSSYILVNKYGKRFTNIALKLSHTKRLALTGFSDYLYFDGQSDDPASKSEYTNYPFYIIFDESHRSKRRVGGSAFKGLYSWSADNTAEIANGLITKADTIADLAAKMGIDAAGLSDTITRYNAYCTGGSDPEFGTPAAYLKAIETPPYYAAEMCHRYLNTQGGPKRNGKAQVVDKDDNPIPRLYAAGEFGSVYGAIYQGSGNVAEAIMVGRLAGRNAAAEEPWS
ncbi:MAG: FAD-binding protein [Acidobacteria bacterium]|nr:FAD-binding protein [Acidobacteriota bacterium]